MKCVPNVLWLASLCLACGGDGIPTAATQAQALLNPQTTGEGMTPGISGEVFFSRDDQGLVSASVTLRRCPAGRYGLYAVPKPQSPCFAADDSVDKHGRGPSPSHEGSHDEGAALFPTPLGTLLCTGSERARRQLSSYDWWVGDGSQDDLVGQVLEVRADGEQKVLACGTITRVDPQDPT